MVEINIHYLFELEIKLISFAVEQELTQLVFVELLISLSNTLQFYPDCGNLLPWILLYVCFGLKSMLEIKVYDLSTCVIFLLSGYSNAN